MKLTLKEAATLLRRPVRTVRDQAQRGELPARKAGERWVFEREALPLDEAGREALQASAEAVRAAVEEALPSRVATDRRRRRSVADAAAWRVAREVLHGVDEAHPAAAHLVAALDAVALATHRFEKAEKGAALRAARDALASAASALLLPRGAERDTVTLRQVARIEQEAIPALAGLIRWSTAA